MTSQPLTGKVALITGSSRGIGREIALELARLGADIVVHYVRKKTAAHQTAIEIEAMGRKTIVVKANLVDPAQIDNLFDEIESVFGRCDIFIGNAASGTPRDI